MAEIKKLTDLEVRAANVPGKYFDGGGLFLSVTPRRGGGVTKSWLVRFTSPDRRSREMGLGAYPEVSLADARAAACIIGTPPEACTLSIQTPVEAAASTACATVFGMS